MLKKKKASSHEELVNQTLEAIEQLMRSAFASGNVPYWVEEDLTFSQLKALHLIRHFQTLTVSELARLLGMGNPAASILVNQLVQQDMVERSEDVKDRRRTFVKLTPKGIGLLVERREHGEAQIRPVLSKMAEADLASLLRGFHAMAEIIRKERAQTDQAQAAGAFSLE
ncbi:MAG TPA: MarR family transcriptional regulator, partial [Anaerolineae bacterium]|nr:MarR family transcriptional regulator [Anaerolineae bacterium]